MQILSFTIFICPCLYHVYYRWPNLHSGHSILVLIKSVNCPQGHTISVTFCWVVCLSMCSLKKRILDPKFFGPNILCLLNFRSKKICPKKLRFINKFWSKYIWVKRSLVEKMGSPKFKAPNKFG